jgi:hypothetical protein
LLNYGNQKNDQRRTDDNFTSAGPFVSFDDARKNAEMNVGFNWKELADVMDNA